MSELQIALRNAGLLEIVEAKAREFGTTIEEAIKLLASSKTAGTRLTPGTPEFYDAVCVKLTGNKNSSYQMIKKEAEKSAGMELDINSIFLYALTGKVATCLISDAELADIEEAVNYVLGQ